MLAHRYGLEVVELSCGPSDGNASGSNRIKEASLPGSANRADKNQNKRRNPAEESANARLRREGERAFEERKDVPNLERS
ncbi:hypothetical protein Y032_0018g3726 [Ancylostoma ceylanicum]|uniref:Uncharacterized protein n=1 Tax=Ancylostoma ceylanicum TaxID=53326 RepID=A0A016V5X7_9BILA|nr:hypothetical protein Y032_0018g3726 [Ancylostoma ceylanicum]